MRRTLVLLLDEEGKVKKVNKAAQEQFGDCLSKPCQQVINAAKRDGSAHCTDSCMKELVHHNVDSEQQVTIDGNPGTMTCSVIDNEIVVAIQESTNPITSNPLTPREHEVMALIAEGLTNRLIAKRLGIKTPTVRTHVEHILDKLSAKSRAEAVSRALASGQLVLSPESFS